MRLIYRLLFACVLLFTTSSLLAQNSISSYSLINKIVKQYEKAEWNINIPTSFKNPYDQKEVSLNMLLTSPSGKPLSLPCYYDNVQKNWKARFAPQESGKYSYVFSLSVGTRSTESAKSTFNSVSTPKAGFLHKNNLWTFKFDNGQPFRGIGENVGWEARSNENAKWTYNYLLPTLSSNGANFFRTWMSSWNLPLEWKRIGNNRWYKGSDEYFNPSAIKRMDELVNLNDSLGLYLMLTLDWHGHISSNGFNNSNYNVRNGGPAKNPTEYFTLLASIEMYKNKLRYIVARWGYSTSIAAWEFFNEVDNGVFNSRDSILIPHEAVTHWHREMSRYLKDIDPYNHLVTTSISHRDIEGMNSIPYIDFNQKHIYKHTEKIPAIYPDYIQTYGKPYVIGEFGFRWEDANPQYAKEFNYDYKRGLWFGMFSPTPILPMTWWWELFDTQGMTPYFNGVREISDKMLKTGNGNFTQFSVKAGTLHSQAVKCGGTYFVYLLNETDERISTPVSFSTNTEKAFAVQSFDPESRRYLPINAFTAVNKNLKINNLALNGKTALILIITGK